MNAAVRIAPAAPAMSSATRGGDGGEEAEESDETLLSLSDLERVQRKWQMASCVHFLCIFGSYLPYSEAGPLTHEHIDTLSIERAIAEPEVDAALALLLRDVYCTLLLAIKVLKKNRLTYWFSTLKNFILDRSAEFPDLFANANGNCTLHYWDNGLEFIHGSTWNLRLAILLALCDIAAEEAECIRDALREKDRHTNVTKTTTATTTNAAAAAAAAASALLQHNAQLVQPAQAVHNVLTNANGNVNISVNGNASDNTANANGNGNGNGNGSGGAVSAAAAPSNEAVQLQAQTPMQGVVRAPSPAQPCAPEREREVPAYRLSAIGRCSGRRYYYVVGKNRIFSGFKRKGNGLLRVECSDGTGMQALVERLQKSQHPRDRLLGSRIRDKHLTTLLE